MSLDSTVRYRNLEINFSRFSVLSKHSSIAIQEPCCTWTVLWWRFDFPLYPRVSDSFPAVYGRWSQNHVPGVEPTESNSIRAVFDILLWSCLSFKLIFSPLLSRAANIQPSLLAMSLSWYTSAFFTVSENFICDIFSQYGAVSCASGKAPLIPGST